MQPSITEQYTQELSIVAPDLSAPIAITGAATLAQAHVGLMLQAISKTTGRYEPDLFLAHGARLHLESAGNVLGPLAVHVVGAALATAQPGATAHLPCTMPRRSM